jgi:hypothetical protein
MYGYFYCENLEPGNALTSVTLQKIDDGESIVDGSGSILLTVASDTTWSNYTYFSISGADNASFAAVLDAICNDLTYFLFRTTWYPDGQLRANLVGMRAVCALGYTSWSYNYFYSWGNSNDNWSVYTYDWGDVSWYYCHAHLTHESTGELTVDGSCEHPYGYITTVELRDAYGNSMITFYTGSGFNATIPYSFTEYMSSTDLYNFCTAVSPAASLYIEIWVGPSSYDLFYLNFIDPWTSNGCPGYTIPTPIPVPVAPTPSPVSGSDYWYKYYIESHGILAGTYSTANCYMYYLDYYEPYIYGSIYCYNLTSNITGVDFYTVDYGETISENTGSLLFSYDVDWLSQSNSYVYVSLDISDYDVQQICDDKSYFIIRTADYPYGELRGNIVGMIHTCELGSYYLSYGYVTSFGDNYYDWVVYNYGYTTSSWYTYCEAYFTYESGDWFTSPQATVAGYCDFSNGTITSIELKDSYGWTREYFYWSSYGFPAQAQYSFTLSWNEDEKNEFCSSITSPWYIQVEIKDTLYPGSFEYAQIYLLNSLSYCPGVIVPTPTSTNTPTPTPTNPPGTVTTVTVTTTYETSTCETTTTSTSTTTTTVS